MRDTGAVWMGALVPGDRAKIMRELRWAQFVVKDDEAQENLALFGAVLATTK